MRTNAKLNYIQNNIDDLYEIYLTSVNNTFTGEELFCETDVDNKTLLLMAKVLGARTAKSNYSILSKSDFQQRMIDTAS